MKVMPPQARLRRLGALAAGGALVAAGLLAPAIAAEASPAAVPDVSGFAPQTVYKTDIQPVEFEGEKSGNYDAWHIGSDAQWGSFDVTGAGVLELTSAAVTSGHSVQLIKGYPSAGRPDMDDLRAILDEGVAVDTAGDNAGFLQIAYHWGPDGHENQYWGTLYPVTPTAGHYVASLDQTWKNTKAIGTGPLIPANTSTTLDALLDALEAQENFTVSAFGISNEGSPSATTQVTALYWDGVKYVFAENRPEPALNAFTTETVYQADIQPEELEGEVVGNYDAWHIGSDAQYGSFSVTNTGVLELTSAAVTGGHSVQLLKGYSKDAPRPGISDLRAILNEGVAVDTTGSNPGYLQIAVHWGASSQFWATLRPFAPTVGTYVASPDQTWVSSKPIGALIAANTEATLADLLLALGQQDNFTVSGFGISNEGSPSATTQVTALYWDGVKYVFASTKPVAANVTGTVAVGRTLTASHLTWDADATYSYQWYRDSSAISGAKSKTYLLTASDYGHTIKVRVTATKPGTVTRATSAATAKVGKGTIDVTGALGVSGTVAVGVKLTASLPAFDTQQDVAGNQSGVTVKYQWYRGASKISGATMSTYTLTSSDLGAAISVHTSVSKSGYTSRVLASADTAAVAKGTLAVTLAPTVKSSVKGGAFVAGKKVTASSSGWTANGVSTTSVTKRYFWFIYDASGPSAEPTIGDLVSVTTTGSFTLPSWTKGAGLSVAVYVVGTKSGYSGVQSDLSIAHAIQ
jgi:hypothetical protein